jgi:hypothetical protein
VAQELVGALGPSMPNPSHSIARLKIGPVVTPPHVFCSTIDSAAAWAFGSS